MAELTAEARARLDEAEALPRMTLTIETDNAVVVSFSDLRSALATIDTQAAEITRLRSRTYTDEEVERAARAYDQANEGEDIWQHVGFDELERSYRRAAMRAALASLSQGRE